MKISNGRFAAGVKLRNIPAMIFIGIPVVARNAWISKYPYRGQMLTLNQIAKIEYCKGIRKSWRAALDWADKNDLIPYVIMSGKLPPDTYSIDELTR